jgi:hypothetical protein
MDHHGCGQCSSRLRYHRRLLARPLRGRTTHRRPTLSITNSQLAVPLGPDLSLAQRDELAVTGGLAGLALRESYLAAKERANQRREGGETG